jgi:hypothetical protein
MVVPEAPDELFGEEASAGEDLTSLYGGGDTEAVVDQSQVVDDPAAFNPAIGFQQSTTKSSAPPLPMKLILMAGGGVLGLILIVAVVIVVVMSGGDDDSNNGNASDALAFDANIAVPAGNTAPPIIRPDVPPSNPLNPDDSDPPTDPNDSDDSGSGGDDADTGDDETTDGDADADEDVEPDTDEPVTPPVYVANLLAPQNADYAMIVPDDLDVISRTRVAIRTTPMDDGTWLSMEVHKLAGLERRQASPIADDRATVLLRGRRIAMPDGVEVSEIASDHFTITRLLHPERTGQPLRRVEYVIKDGPYLISVLGRVPADDMDRLAQFDEAAKSVQPVGDD